MKPPAHDEAAAAAALSELWRAVQADPSAFDFYALLRRVDTLRRQHPRTGEAQRPRQEAVRLAQAPELDFAPAPLHALQWPAGRAGHGAPRLVVRFFGLLGPMGPMPLHFTEVVRERILHHSDTTLAHFLDLFHHRLLSLFYRAWAQAQPVVHLDRPHEDRYRVWVGALGGVPANTGALPPQALAHHAGWFTARSRHPEMLAKVIGQFFGVQVQVQEHVCQWLAVDRGERTALAHSRYPAQKERPKQSQRTHAKRGETPTPALGRSANAGSRVWDRQHRFRLHLGPLTHAQTLSFLPGGEAWPRLVQWVRLLAGRELQWELQLELDERERPPPRLGRTPMLSPLLGVTFRLGRAASGRRGATSERALRLRPHTSFLAHRPGFGIAAHGAVDLLVH